MKKFPLVLVLILLLAACQESSPGKAAAQPAEVDVAIPVTHAVTEWDDFTGRFEALARVDIRARVTGYLVEKHFRDGQFVKKGDVLFVIDPRPFEYEMQRANAQYTLAKKTYERAQGLRKTKAISQEIFDQRLQELQVAQAALDEARLNLGFTKVKASIDGKISRSFVDLGNLVSADQTMLSRIVTIDPIHFVFEGSQANLLKYLRLDRAGKRPSSDNSPNPIFIKLLDEKTFAHKGRMDFVDNIIDAGTGTVLGRALVENKDGIIYPGLFGRARLLGRSDEAAILLPEKAVNSDQDKKFVYVVNADNQVQRQYITPGPLLDNGLIIIREGLKGDEHVVVNGVQRIRVPKQTVTPIMTVLEWTDIESIPDINSVPSLEEIAGKTAATDSQ